MAEIRLLGIFFWIGLAILIFAAVTFVVAVYGEGPPPLVVRDNNNQTQRVVQDNIIELDPNEKIGLYAVEGLWIRNATANNTTIPVSNNEIVFEHPGIFRLNLTSNYGNYSTVVAVESGE